MKMMDSQLVWARDSSAGYIQGHITEIGPTAFEVTPTNTKYPKRTCSTEDIFPSCEGEQDHDDNCEYKKKHFSCQITACPLHQYLYSLLTMCSVFYNMVRFNLFGY